MGKLTVAKIRALKKPGLYSDGDTLYLKVSKGGTKSFVQRLTIDGEPKDLGLGGWPLRSLGEGRIMAFDNRKVARNGGDPRVGTAGTPTFREAAEEVHKELLPTWKNKHHAKSWLQTLEKHAYPVLADMLVNRIQPRHVLSVVKPIWNTRPETARRVRQRIRTVLASCLSHEYVDRNVAGDGLDGALHRQRDKQHHHRMLPYKEVPQLARELQSGAGTLVNRLCLLFTILTATRGIEAREAPWDEIDREDRMWRIPDLRMKVGKDHHQPLSQAAFEVLDQAWAFHNASGLIFPSHNKPQQPLSNNAAMNLLKRLGYHDRATTHGFRATFRTWATDCTTASEHAKRLSTAHDSDHKMDGPYDRAFVLDERRDLMEMWGCYVMGRPCPPEIESYLARKRSGSVSGGPGSGGQ